MVNGFIDIHKLNMEELHGVITLYPWFGAARTELCRRMSELGEGAWSDESYADAALYVSSRKIIAELAHKGHETQYADADIRALLRAYITEDVASARTDVKRKPGGDYFTREEYESVKKEGDADFARFAKVNENADVPAVESSEFADFCTETLAEIYAGQGYNEQARQIYSQLSLRFPEKSAYFAALIEKLKK